MQIDKTVIPVRNDSITEKELENEIILYNKTDHNVHSLNLTAAILWNLCDGKMTVLEMIAYLLDKFKGDKKLIEEDVIKTLEEMQGKNLITMR